MHPPSAGGGGEGGGGVQPPTNFSKNGGRGLIRSRGSCWERGGEFSHGRGVAVFPLKKTEIFTTKNVYKKNVFPY